jgi:Fe2+ or Zn2+ uptake regulation protein
LGTVESMATAAAIDQELTERLRVRGQRVTAQRLVLYRALRELGRHASVDEVLRLASERIPNVSPPTVYASLDLFEGLGLVRRLDVGSGPALYDPRPETHHHLVCRRCGRVEDLDTPVDLSPALSAASAAGFAASGAQVVVEGRCRYCAETEGAQGER